MKTLALSICVLFSFSVIDAQSDSLVHGLWKIISIKIEDVYFNLKTDSISLPNEMKELFNDQSKQQTLADNIRTVYSGTEFHFKSDGTLKMIISGLVLNGSYRLITEEKVIEIITKNSLNETVADKIFYKLINGYLYLNMNWEEERVEIVLERN